MRKMRKILKKILPQKVKKFLSSIINSFGRKTYSQAGEDAFLEYLFRQRNLISDGFYIDVGALHPDHLSNTKLFYKKGWRGINIDALPGSMRKFNQKRKKDINLELAISDREGEVDFYVFENKALNTLSKEFALQLEGEGEKIKDIIKIKTNTLKWVLDNYLEKNQKISFLSIDAEGVDLEVLKSNDWASYRPRVIIIESAQFDLDNPSNSDIYNYLKTLNYKFISKINVNLVFEDLVL